MYVCIYVCIYNMYRHMPGDSNFYDLRCKCLT